MGLWAGRGPRSARRRGDVETDEVRRCEPLELVIARSQIHDRGVQRQSRNGVGDDIHFHARCILSADIEDSCDVAILAVNRDDLSALLLQIGKPIEKGRHIELQTSVEELVLASDLVRLNLLGIEGRNQTGRVRRRNTCTKAARVSACVKAGIDQIVRCDLIIQRSPEREEFELFFLTNREEIIWYGRDRLIALIGGNTLRCKAATGLIKIKTEERIDRIIGVRSRKAFLCGELSCKQCIVGGRLQDGLVAPCRRQCSVRPT